MFREEERGHTVSALDLISVLLLMFLSMVILMFPYVNEITRQEDEESKKPQGNVMVEMFWQNVNSDVDLWVKAPSDVPVGYSNKGGKVFNLLRDDLGDDNDVSGVNMEIAYSRGIPAGEYQANVHLYATKQARVPLIAKVVISVQKPEGDLTQILVADVKLAYSGHEVTVFRFKLTKEGDLVEGSVHQIHRELRSARSMEGPER